MQVSRSVRHMLHVLPLAHVKAMCAACILSVTALGAQGAEVCVLPFTSRAPGKDATDSEKTVALVSADLLSLYMSTDRLVVERQSVNASIGRLALNEGAATEAYGLKVGRGLKAAFVVQGSYALPGGNTVDLSVRVLATDSGGIITQASGSGSITNIPLIAWNLSRELLGAMNANGPKADRATFRTPQAATSEALSDYGKALKLYDAGNMGESVFSFVRATRGGLSTEGRLWSGRIQLELGKPNLVHDQLVRAYSNAPASYLDEPLCAEVSWLRAEICRKELNRKDEALEMYDICLRFPRSPRYPEARRIISRHQATQMLSDLKQHFVKKTSYLAEMARTEQAIRSLSDHDPEGTAWWEENIFAPLRTLHDEAIRTIPPVSEIVVESRTEPGWPSVTLKTAGAGESIWLTGRKLDRLELGKSVELTGFRWGDIAEFEIRGEHGINRKAPLNLRLIGGNGCPVVFSGLTHEEASLLLAKWKDYLSEAMAKECQDSLGPPAISVTTPAPNPGRPAGPSVKVVSGTPAETIQLEGKRYSKGEIPLPDRKWGDELSYDVCNSSGIRFQRAVTLAMTNLLASVGLDDAVDVGTAISIRNAWSNHLSHEYLATIDDRIERMTDIGKDTSLVVWFDKNNPARPYCELQGNTHNVTVMLQSGGGQQEWKDRSTRLPPNCRWGSRLAYVVVNPYRFEYKRELLLNPTNTIEEVFAISRDTKWKDICTRWKTYDMEGSPRRELSELLSGRAQHDLYALLAEYASQKPVADPNGLRAEARNSKSELPEISGFGKGADVAGLFTMIDKLAGDDAPQPRDTVTIAQGLGERIPTFVSPLRPDISNRCWKIVANTLIRGINGVKNQERKELQGQDWSGWKWIGCLDTVNRTWGGMARSDTNVMACAASLFSGMSGPASLVMKDSADWKALESLGLATNVYRILKDACARKIGEIKNATDMIAFLEEMDHVTGKGHPAEPMWGSENMRLWSERLNSLETTELNALSTVWDKLGPQTALEEKAKSRQWWRPLAQIRIEQHATVERWRNLGKQIAAIESEFGRVGSVPELLQWLEAVSLFRKGCSSAEWANLWDAAREKRVKSLALGLGIDASQGDLILLRKRVGPANIADAQIAALMDLAVNVIQKRYEDERQKALAVIDSKVKDADAAFDKGQWAKASGSFRDAAGMFRAKVAKFGTEFTSCARICDINTLLCELKESQGEKLACADKAGTLSTIDPAGLPAECATLIKDCRTFKTDFSKKGSSATMGHLVFKDKLSKYKESFKLPLLNTIRPDGQRDN